MYSYRYFCFQSNTTADSNLSLPLLVFSPLTIRNLILISHSAFIYLFYPRLYNKYNNQYTIFLYNSNILASVYLIKILFSKLTQISSFISFNVVLLLVCNTVRLICFYMGYILGSSLCLDAFHFYAGETYSLKTFFCTLVKKEFNSEIIQYLYDIIFHILIYLEFILTYGIRNDFANSVYLSTKLEAQCTKFSQACTLSNCPFRDI